VWYKTAKDFGLALVVFFSFLVTPRRVVAHGVGSIFGRSFHCQLLKLACYFFDAQGANKLHRLVQAAPRMTMRKVMNSLSAMVMSTEDGGSSNWSFLAEKWSEFTGVSLEHERETRDTMWCQWHCDWFLKRREIIVDTIFSSW
jgi:hypothetical protein